MIAALCFRCGATCGGRRYADRDVGQPGAGSHAPAGSSRHTDTASRAPPGSRRRGTLRLARPPISVVVAGCRWCASNRCYRLVRTGCLQQMMSGAESSPPPHNPAQPAGSVGTCYEEQQSERDQDAMAETDVGIGGLAHAYLATE